jgi:hypothetical protein
MVADRGCRQLLCFAYPTGTVLMPWIPVYAYICKKSEVSGRSHYQIDRTTLAAGAYR